MPASGKYLGVRLVMIAYILLHAASASAVAQEDSTRFCRSAIYIEGFGQGLFYSVNYDLRVTQEFGVRVGFTSWSITSLFVLVAGEIKITGFPIMANFLYGDRNHCLELGAGIVPAIVSLEGQEIFLGTVVDGQVTMVFGTATIGYRYQPVHGGLLFRIGLTPLFTFKDSFISGGISFGYTF